MNKWGTRDFYGRKTLLCDTVMVETWYYAFVRTHRTIQHKVLILM